MFKWGRGRIADETPTGGTNPGNTAARSTVMPKFLAAVAHRPNPVLLDLGPVGPNVEFFNERLACKLYVQDLFVNVEAHSKRRAADPETGPPVLTPQLGPAPASVDGILCWDLFDYLDPASGLTLATALTGLLRPGGVLHGLFATSPVDVAHYTQFVLTIDVPATTRLKTALQRGTMSRMTESDGNLSDVLDLSPVQVDDAGRLFISPVIHDWQVVTQRGIDTVVDLEGGLDIGVPTVPNQCLYVYFPIYDEELPNLNKLHGIASLCADLVAGDHRVLSHCGMGFNRSALVAGLVLHKLGMPGPAVVGRLRTRRPGALFNERFASFLQTL